MAAAILFLGISAIVFGVFAVTRLLGLHSGYVLALAFPTLAMYRAGAAPMEYLGDRSEAIILKFNVLGPTM